MSDAIKHECGIALLRLLKPLSYYKEKYGNAFYGVDKMYLMLEKQHNRGQDGAGLASIKLGMQPGERYISRARSNSDSPIKDVFTQVNESIARRIKENPEAVHDMELLKKVAPYIGEVFLGHVRYGTYGENSIESVHPFLRQNNWKARNLLVAGNFNLTNVDEQFQNLIDLGQHPKAKADTVTVMEKIGHFLDEQVNELYYELKKEGYSKREASAEIENRIKVSKILARSAKNWDGGYAMAGLFGHGDAFVLRDPAGIRPAYYYVDDEIAIVASERPVIQTVFNVSFNHIKELNPGEAIIIKHYGEVKFRQILEPLERKSCSFERIYFSRGSDAEIYEERKELGRLLINQVMEAIDGDIHNTVFSYIPNTAEASYFGLVEAANDELNHEKTQMIMQEKEDITDKRIKEILSTKLRSEKIAIKDAKLRTFITQDNARDDMVAHVYDVTYGVVKPTDNLVIIDDSIVRGTTLKNSIIRILDRVHPKRIVVVSSAPQIRYPDCYGIDMARLENLIAFVAAEALHRERGTEHLIEEIYQKCKSEVGKPDKEVTNYVKEFYAPFTDEEISNKIAELLTTDDINAEVKIIYQSVENLHKACPKNLGDWYFTGNYPTAGGNRVANKAFINYYEGNKERAY
ncbi:amidophosphoribosyltransferase [Ornithobacterium rhinotracheale]|uniref:amidophosphoribosyltransferase n=1 Tax=Ornithobacterium rhinotracheale TaxID=28251 RepID=UPI00129CBE8E|nr:amidophosphoribosyltransferase [Ornithobacterium rhinotracheale]MRJ07481.1 amidophosphoribosyltransferase [Ornithobacterium rhinotracheale]UOH78075.1 amidophosphoribosyltransferase [Ornithobacterium rhinotracheale]